MTRVSARPGRPVGHPHFWQRALSRRQFVGAAAGAAGAAVGAPLLLPTLALADEADHDKATALPRPIPGGTTLGPTLFHFFLPGHGSEPSSITDFHGVIGLAAIGGMGHDSGGSKPYDVDVRFFKGLFVGADGKHHHGTFGFA